MRKWKRNFGRKLGIRLTRIYFTIGKFVHKARVYSNIRSKSSELSWDYSADFEKHQWRRFLWDTFVQNLLNSIIKKLQCSQISKFLRFKMVWSSSFEKYFSVPNCVQNSWPFFTPKFLHFFTTNILLYTSFFFTLIF